MKKLKPTTKQVILDMNYIALFAALIAVCSWTSIPGPNGISFTLQTMGVMLAVGTLGGRRGTIAVLLYIVLGLIGVPVFAGFNGGPGVLFGTTGGYIVGFIFLALIMWLFEKVCKKNIFFLALSMVVGMIVCYLFGTIWFMIIYTKNTGAVSFWTALSWCVIPYLFWDFLKMVIALLLCGRLRKLFDVKVKLNKEAELVETVNQEELENKEINNNEN